MNNTVMNRTWISPITSLTFFIVGVTGILMAFHIKNGGIKTAHEWIGYAFALAGFLHLIISWKVLVAYFRKRSAILASVTGLILSLAVFYIGGTRTHQKPHPLMRAFDQNRNGVIDADEVSSAASSLTKFDTNNDGIISITELMSKGGARGKQHQH